MTQLETIGIKETKLPDLYAPETVNILSFSGGKDSAALYLLAMEMGVKFTPVCADTGNEHEATLDYVRNFHALTGGPEVRIIKADFTNEILRKRKFIANDRRTSRRYKIEKVFDDAGEPVMARNKKGVIILDKKGAPKQKTKKVGAGKKIRYTNKQKRRILEHLHPTGNPFLDLCLWKGRMPSRTAQFCTEELKRNTIIEQIYFPEIDEGKVIVSWQGVRAEESHSRAKLPEIDSPGGGIFNYRPILKLTSGEVFDKLRAHNIPANPLYKQGFSRVGCMPCINCSKNEIYETARRFPEHIQRIRDWENLVGLCSKLGEATLFSPVKKGEIRHIDKVIHWSKTKHGGRKLDEIKVIEFDDFDRSACNSAYGLCE